MASLDLNAIAKAYGAVTAVAPFDLAVGDGEFVTLLGPSGCGKTTIMRIVAGITRADTGDVRIGGRSVTGLAPERRNVGLVFQSYALFPHMTVAANVGFGLKMRGVGRRPAAERVERALGLVDLAAYRERFPRELSGGQQQRVALARALVIEPDVLLLDEPLSNLDAKLREQLREQLRDLQRRLGVTTVYVTHDQAEAMAMADRILVMNRGRLVEEGAPERLYRTPSTRFAAEFLGQTNVVEADCSGGSAVLPWGETVEMPGRNGRVALSIRPEDVAIAAIGEGPGRVESATFLGGIVEYAVRFGDCRLRIRATGSGAPILSPQTPIAVRLQTPPHPLSEIAPATPEAA